MARTSNVDGRRQRVTHRHIVLSPLPWTRGVAAGINASTDRHTRRHRVRLSSALRNVSPGSIALRGNHAHNLCFTVRHLCARLRSVAMPTQGTNLVRRQLGRKLRRLREAADKSEQDIVESTICSRASLWRIETGRDPVKVGPVRGVSWLY